MDKYKIRINPEAANDLEDIVDYLAARSEEVALKYYDLLVDCINSLSEMPTRCPYAKDTQLRLRGYRTLFVKNYIVFYVISGKTVEVFRILYARRQYEGLL